MIDSFREVFRTKNWPVMIADFIVFMAFLQIGTFIHELGHALAGILLNCGGVVEFVNFFTGASYVGMCPADSRMILVALAGPMAGFMFGMYLWSIGKDMIFRLGGITAWMYSTLPNLFPLLGNGSDIAVAMEYGLTPFAAWTIYIIITSIVAFFIVQEIQDQK